MGIRRVVAQPEPARAAAVATDQVSGDTGFVEERSRSACPEKGNVTLFWCVSELYHRQTGNAPEVARIDGQHRISERECGGTDEEIREGNDDATGLLLGVQLARKLRDVCRQWVDDHSGADTHVRVRFGTEGSVACLAGALAQAGSNPLAPTSQIDESGLRVTVMVA